MKDTRNSPYPAGKHRKSLEHESSIPAGIYPVDSSNFLCFLARTGLKSSGKIQKTSAQNTASIKSLELPATGRFRSGLFDLSSRKSSGKARRRLCLIW
jgi:hypothetical protein